jgi:hypothetical protein
MRSLCRSLKRGREDKQGVDRDHTLLEPSGLPAVFKRTIVVYFHSHVYHAPLTLCNLTLLCSYFDPISLLLVAYFNAVTYEHNHGQQRFTITDNNASQSRTTMLHNHEAGTYSTLFHTSSLRGGQPNLLL